ncbi:hypothetical protein ACOME3_002273 [Neoechinorhynchus agilis]
MVNRGTPERLHSDSSNLSASAEGGSLHAATTSAAAAVSLAGDGVPSLQCKSVKCSVCLRVFKPTLSGLVRSHGQHGSHCPGSRKPPTQPASPSSSNPCDLTELTTVVTDTNAPPPALIEMLSHCTRMIRRIPRSARSSAASKLACLIECIIRDPTVPSDWFNLLAFPKAVLRFPTQTAEANENQSLSQKIRNRSDAFESFEQVEHLGWQSHRRNFPHDPDSQLRAKCSEKLEDGDLRGAVRLVSGTDRLLAPNKDILDSLKLKHPPRRRSCFKPNYDPSFTEPDRDPLIPITVSTVTSALISFPPSSAGGHDGLSPRHIRDLTCFSSGAQGTRLLKAITELTRVIVRGSVPPPVARLLCGAKLIACTKKGGGVRPIAVGCTFRRLASKVACQFATDRLIDQLLPVQLGVGVPAGAEAAVHSARAYSRNGINKGTAMVKLDMENAFNSICRTAMTEVVRQHIPEIYQYVSLCYDQSSMLLFGEFQVESAEGVQQGDPLGPLLFALTINHLAHSSSSDLSIWYLDDCCIGGEIDQLIRDIKNISEMGADIGLFLRTDKCEIISDDQEDASRLLTALPGAKTTATDSADILGSPIGNLSNLETFLSKAIDQLRLTAARLLHIARHDALFILSRCLSLPKIAYLLRTSPCFRSVLTRDFDNCVRSTLSEVLNL